MSEYLGGSGSSPTHNALSFPKRQHSDHNDTQRHSIATNAPSRSPPSSCPLRDNKPTTATGDPTPPPTATKSKTEIVFREEAALPVPPPQPVPPSPSPWADRTVAELKERPNVLYHAFILAAMLCGGVLVVAFVVHFAQVCLSPWRAEGPEFTLWVR